MESAFQGARFFDACRGGNTLTIGSRSGSLPVANLKKGGDALAPMFLCSNCSDGTLQLMAKTNCPVIMQNHEALNLTQSYRLCILLNQCTATLRQVVAQNRNAWSLPPKYALVGDQLELSRTAVADVAAYWVYGAENLPRFVPDSAPGYPFLPSTSTTWSSSAGVSDPDAPTGATS